MEMHSQVTSRPTASCSSTTSTSVLNFWLPPTDLAVQDYIGAKGFILLRKTRQLGREGVWPVVTMYSISALS